MYEQHYGLRRRPFRATALGADVFVGPQTARFLQAARKATAARDAAIAVIGAAGVGKTTLVNRFLDGLDGEVHVVRIARLKLDHDEVLDFLLDEFDAEVIPASTIRKMALFKKLLEKRVNAGARVIFTIEDAVRIGDDALAELEALTAADTHDGTGAMLILMGEETLRQTLETEALARLKQRVRLYSEVRPLPGKEFEAYLKHGFRVVGADLDRIFAEGSAVLLHELTGGIPRITNGLIESVLIAGHERTLATIDLPVIREVAEEEYGLKQLAPDSGGARLEAGQETEQKAAEQRERQAAAEPGPQAAGEPAPEPAPESAASVAEPAGGNNDLPDLEIVAPEVARPAAASAAADDSPDGTEADTIIQRLPARDNPDDEEIPTLYCTGSQQVTPEEEPEETDEIATTALGFEPAVDFGALLAPDAGCEPGSAEMDEAISTASLDESIAKDIATATAALEKHDATIGGPRSKYTFEAVPKQEQETEAETAVVESQHPDPPPQNADESGRMRIARQLSAAATLDDVDDQMAESLFNTCVGLSIAGQAGKRPAPGDASASAEGPTGELELVPDKPTQKPVQAPAAPAVPVPSMPLTASQRLATVLALNARQSAAAKTSLPGPGAQGLNAIEDQVAPPSPTAAESLGVDEEPANDDNVSKRGFFSRFRRS